MHGVAATPSIRLSQRVQLMGESPPPLVDVAPAGRRARAQEQAAELAPRGQVLERRSWAQVGIV